MNILNDQWEAQCAYYRLNIVAANLLIVGFAATLLFSGSLALVCLAALNMLGNALYNSADDYKKYKQASVAVQREVTNGKRLQDEQHCNLLTILKKECNQANINFLLTLTYNGGATAFVITAAAISWPVALGISIAYMAYRLNNVYQKQLQQDDNKKEKPMIFIVCLVLINVQYLYQN